MQHWLVAAALAVAVTGCVDQFGVRPGGTPAQLSQDMARCRLFSRGMNPGDFYAQGSPRFVAGAAIGNAIGTGFAQAATYNDCMMAVGYTPEAPQSSVVTPVVAAAPQSSAVTPAVQAAQDPPESVITVLPSRPYQREITVLPPRCIEPGTAMFALPDHLDECIAAGGEVVR